MRIQRLTLLPILLLGLLVIGNGCHDQAVVAPDSSESPGVRFAKGGNSPDLNPIGCLQDQVAKWDTSSKEWVCADDLLGAAGFSGYQRVLLDVSSHTYNPADQHGAIAFCPSGKKILGGGFFQSTASGEPLEVVMNGPWLSNPSFEGWSVSLRNAGQTAVTRSFTVYVMCANVS